MRRFLFARIALLWALFASMPTPAVADTFYVDAFSAPGGMDILNAACNGGCVGGYSTGVFTFQPGDTIDFGNVVFFPFLATGRGETYAIVPTHEFTLGPQQNTGPAPVFTTWPCFVFGCSVPVPTAYSVELIVTMPSDQTQVSISWGGPYRYAAPVAPVPELSTWAMLLIGFTGIGFVASRRRRTGSATPSGAAYN
jgi:hypothetical protein